MLYEWLEVPRSDYLDGSSRGMMTGKAFLPRKFFCNWNFLPNFSNSQSLDCKVLELQSFIGAMIFQWGNSEAGRNLSRALNSTRIESKWTLVFGSAKESIDVGGNHSTVFNRKR